ncbi:hypothetical protein FA002_24030 [Priestia megaterium]|uniref:hypothetical protein n=1 Tax=Priestia megaterium TaxID=1404 RepID=UPI0010AD1880|nr:hypothetical protein [Priestia megaterium]TJZ32248.1 hypothetical protein FA002_24030 [Priestia megaterium]
MLQNGVNELHSGILDMLGKKVYVTGFTREEMLNSHLDKGIENWSSKGFYDYEDLNFHNIKNNALILVREDGKEVARYQYKPIFRNTIQFKDEQGKLSSFIFRIRKSTYSEHYHFLTEKISVLFDSKAKLDKHLLEKYGVSYTY